MTELLGIWYMHVVSHIMITRLSYAVITCYIENLCFTVYLRMIDWLMAFCFVQAFVACLNAFNVQDSLLFYKFLPQNLYEMSLHKPDYRFLIHYKIHPKPGWRRRAYIMMIFVSFHQSGILSNLACQQKIQKIILLFLIISNCGWLLEL